MMLLKTDTADRRNSAVCGSVSFTENVFVTRQTSSAISLAARQACRAQ